MKAKIFLLAAVVSFVVFACSDDDDPISGSIAGKWQSDKAEFTLDPEGPLPGYTITEEDFDVQLEFKSDGTVSLTDDGVTTTGTYTLSGRSLILEINYDVEFIGLSGTYHVQELSDTKLRTEIKKEGTFQDPDSGQQFEGEITATLYFDRMP